MTYDYTSLMSQTVKQMQQRGFKEIPTLRWGPIAPAQWVSDAMEYLVSLKPASADKLYLGLNFYGQDYIQMPDGFLNPNPITGDQYVKLVKAHAPKIRMYYTIFFGK